MTRLHSVFRYLRDNKTWLNNLTRLVTGVIVIYVATLLCRYATYLTIFDNISIKQLPLFVTEEPVLPVRNATEARLGELISEGIKRNFFQDQRRGSSLKEDEGKLKWLSFEGGGSEVIIYLRSTPNAASDLLDAYDYSSLWELLTHLIILNRDDDEFKILQKWVESGIDLPGRHKAKVDADAKAIAKDGGGQDNDCAVSLCGASKINLVTYINYLDHYYARFLPVLLASYRCDDAASLATGLAKRAVLIGSPRGPVIDIETRLRKSRVLLYGIFFSRPALCQQDNDGAAILENVINSDFDQGAVDIFRRHVQTPALVPAIGYVRYVTELRNGHYDLALRALESIDSGSPETLFSELIVLQMARLVFWAWQANPDVNLVLQLTPKSQFLQNHPSLTPDLWTNPHRRLNRSTSTRRLTELQNISRVVTFRSDIEEYINIINAAVGKK